MCVLPHALASEPFERQCAIYGLICTEDFDTRTVLVQCARTANRFRQTLPASDLYNARNECCKMRSVRAHVPVLRELPWM